MSKWYSIRFITPNEIQTKQNGKSIEPFTEFPMEQKKILYIEWTYIWKYNLLVIIDSGFYTFLLLKCFTFFLKYLFISHILNFIRVKRKSWPYTLNLSYFLSVRCKQRKRNDWMNENVCSINSFMSADRYSSVGSTHWAPNSIHNNAINEFDHMFFFSRKKKKNLCVSPWVSKEASFATNAKSNQIKYYGQ